jgi:hypothetical protein
LKIEIFIALIVLMTLVICYLLPSLIAYARGHNNKLAILVLNMILGWTLLGWCVALIWSFTADNT